MPRKFVRGTLSPDHSNCYILWAESLGRSRQPHFVPINILKLCCTIRENFPAAQFVQSFAVCCEALLLGVRRAEVEVDLATLRLPWQQVPPRYLDMVIVVQ